MDHLLSKAAIVSGETLEKPDKYISPSLPPRISLYVRLRSCIICMYIVLSAFNAGILRRNFQFDEFRFI